MKISQKTLRVIKNEYGCDSLRDYLQSLADEYGLPYSVVAITADMMGESELFDGLINSLEDGEGMFDF